MGQTTKKEHDDFMSVGVLLALGIISLILHEVLLMKGVNEVLSDALLIFMMFGSLGAMFYTKYMFNNNEKWLGFKLE